MPLWLFRWVRWARRVWWVGFTVWMFATADLAMANHNPAMTAAFLTLTALGAWRAAAAIGARHPAEG